MATEWIFWLNAKVPVAQAAIGNAVAQALDPDTGGGATFSPLGFPVRPIGSQAAEPTVKAAQAPLRPLGYARALAFRGDTRAQILAAGMTEAQADDALAWLAAFDPELLALARAAVTFESGPRAQYDGRLVAWLAEHNEEIIPQSGLTVPS